MQTLGGWRLRFNHGVTRRANSVWPNAATDVPLAECLALVEEFYRRWGGPVRYQICPAAQPADLDERLAERGYTETALTAVQTVPLPTLLSRVSSDAAGATVATQFDDDWFMAYSEVEQVKGVMATGRRGILQRIGPRTGYALLTLDGAPAAIGIGVVERGWLGVLSLATHANARRRGAATAVLGALAQWGAQHDATKSYLQVMDDNAPARALYTRLGFTTLYHYHYREQN